MLKSSIRETEMYQNLNTTFARVSAEYGHDLHCRAEKTQRVGQFVLAATVQGQGYPA